MSALRDEVRHLLRVQGVATSYDVATLCDLTGDAAGAVLWRMWRDGEIERCGRWKEPCNRGGRSWVLWRLRDIS